MKYHCYWCIAHCFLVVVPKGEPCCSWSGRQTCLYFTLEKGDCWIQPPLSRMSAWGSGRRAEPEGQKCWVWPEAPAIPSPLSRNCRKGLQQKWIFIPRTCGVFLKWRHLMGMCQSGDNFQQESQSESIWAFLFCFDNGEMSCFDRDRIVISMMQKYFTSTFLFCYISAC